MNQLFQLLLRLMVENRQRRFRVRTGRGPCGCQVRRLPWEKVEFEIRHS